MWLLLTFTLLNMALGFLGRHILRFSAFDISPAGVAILVWQGNPIILSSLFLSVGYAATSVYDIRYLWLTLPVTILVGLCAKVLPSLILLILLYHLIGALVNWFLQNFNAKYALYIMMNIAVNVMVARLYGVLA